jgi:hypothetical protein
MKSLPVSLFDKALLNGCNVAETIIGHIKEFSSLLGAETGTPEPPSMVQAHRDMMRDHAIRQLFRVPERARQR